MEKWLSLGLVSTGMLAAGLLSAPAAPSPTGASPPARAGGAAAAPAAKQPSAPAAAPAAAVKQGYVGVSACAGCHRPEGQAWSATKHSHEFTGLPIQYRGDPSCLKCHVTGYGDTGGYVVGAPRNAAEDFAVVGCEMCHGPGARHADAAMRFVAATGPTDALEKEMRQTIRKTPPETVCAACHVAQAHGQHPWYAGQPPARRPTAIAESNMSWPDACGRFPPFHFSVKTCAACHYRQYKAWLAGVHSALSASMLPAKYVNDPKCIECHTATSGQPVAAGVASAANGRLGVGCESCHGPARQHVGYNVQFIGPCPLPPQVEQTARQLIDKTRPLNACSGCHVREAHQEHPKYDKS